MSDIVHGLYTVTVTDDYDLCPEDLERLKGALAEEFEARTGDPVREGVIYSYYIYEGFEGGLSYDVCIYAINQEHAENTVEYILALALKKLGIP